MITTTTSNVLFATYIPPGIEAKEVEEHQDLIEANVRLIAPDSGVSFKEIYHARTP
jgi:hypothetical protein